MSDTIHQFPAIVHSQGVPLAARLYRNVNELITPQPTVAVSGSWLTVKEQMSHRYAQELAARGYTVMSFDFAGFGESGGEPRQLESPMRKIADIVAVTRFLASLSFVRGGLLGYVAICASAQYAAAAIKSGAPICSLASIAGWFHDTSTVSAYYGGEAGVSERIRRASVAPDLVPAYESGNERAGMFIPLDYYANKARGAIPEWRNEMDERSWLHWLTFDGLRAAERLEVPTLFIHGDECALPDNVRRIHQHMPGPKRLRWQAGFQVDFYDREDLVTLSVEEADQHFRSTLAV
jgi:uncharacterized protein